MIDLKNKKIIGLTIVSIIIFIASIFLYKQHSSNAFQEEAKYAQNNYQYLE